MKHQSTALLIFGNFLGAFAGSGVISRGLEALPKVPGFSLDSMFAYLVGTVLSLFCILFLKKHILRLGGWLSLGATGMTVVLFSLYQSIELAPSLPFLYLFFFALCLYFALIFVPRTFRTDVAAKTQASLQWVEFAYSLGGLAGLLVWRWFPESRFDSALLLSAGLLLLATAVDFRQSRFQRNPTQNTNDPSVGASQDIPSERSRTGRLSPVLEYGISIILLTLAAQVIPQRLSALSADTAPYIAFTWGILLCPFVFQILNLRMENENGGLMKAKLRVLQFPGIPLAVLPFLVFLAVGMSLSGKSTLGIGVAAFLFETYAILVFGAIGRLVQGPGGVATTYGWMGIVATGFYFLLVLSDAGTRTLLECVVGMGLLQIALSLGLGIFQSRPRPVPATP
jgi:hypothetical protein